MMIMIDTRQYISIEEGESKSWKWSRHFLASKNSSSSSWLMEGNVPEPVSYYYYYYYYYYYCSYIIVFCLKKNS